MPAPQSAKSHTSLDPLTHFILAPIFLITLALAIQHFRHPDQLASLLNIWLMVIAGALILLNFKTRDYSLRIQDRVIRLEERLRLQALLPPAEFTRAQTLTTAQLIALRFASDAELPDLVERTLTENLGAKQIKSSINAWRADNARI